MASLKFNVDKLETTPVDLSKLGKRKMMLVKRLCTMHCLKRLIVFNLLMLVVKLRKLTATQTLQKLKRKNTWPLEIYDFSWNLASKTDYADFVRKILMRN